MPFQVPLSGYTRSRNIALPDSIAEWLQRQFVGKGLEGSHVGPVEALSKHFPEELRKNPNPKLSQIRDTAFSLCRIIWYCLQLQVSPLAGLVSSYA
jgi:hypothetical protein